MKRLCLLLCALLLLLTACGKPAHVQPAETDTSGTAVVTYSEAQTTQAGETGSPTTEPQTADTDAQTTEPQTELPATTAPATTQPTSPQTTAPAVTRESYTLFSIPVRTTSARTTTAPAATKPRTTATTTTKPTTTTTTAPSGHIPVVQPVQKTCTLTIDCRELLAHPEKLKTPEKAAFVPKNGYIVKDVTVTLSGGESVYDVLRKVCATHTCTDNCRFCQAEGIQMESSYSPQFDSYYVEGIHQLYEKDCGGTSGWTYYVNGWFPNYGSSAYAVKPGDRIEWVYSIELDEREKF